MSGGQSGRDVVLVGESAEDLLPVGPVLGWGCSWIRPVPAREPGVRARGGWMRAPGRRPCAGNPMRPAGVHGSEGDDAAQDAAGRDVRVPLVELVEGVRLCDQLIQLQDAVAVEAQQPGNLLTESHIRTRRPRPTPPPRPPRRLTPPESTTESAPEPKIRPTLTWAGRIPYLVSARAYLDIAATGRIAHTEASPMTRSRIWMFSFQDRRTYVSAAVA